MGWTLAEVRALEPDDFAELVQWIADRNKSHDGETVDADEIVAALDEKSRRAAEDNDGA